MRNRKRRRLIEQSAPPAEVVEEVVEEVVKETPKKKTKKKKGFFDKD